MTYADTTIQPDTGNVKKTSRTLTVKGAGTLVATVIEKDGTEHILEQQINAPTTGNVANNQANNPTNNSQVGQ